MNNFVKAARHILRSRMTKAAKKEIMPTTLEDQKLYNALFANHLATNPGWGLGWIPSSALWLPYARKSIRNSWSSQRAANNLGLDENPTIDQAVLDSILEQTSKPGAVEALSKDRPKYQDILFQVLAAYDKAMDKKQPESVKYHESADNLLHLLTNVQKQASAEPDYSDIETLLNADKNYMFRYKDLRRNLYDNSSYLSYHQPYTKEEVQNMLQKAMDNPSFYQDENALTEAIKRIHPKLYWKMHPEFDKDRLLRSWQRSGSIPKADRDAYNKALEILLTNAYLGKIGYTDNYGYELSQIPGKNDEWTFRPIDKLMNLQAEDYPRFKTSPYGLPSEKEVYEAYKKLKPLIKQRDSEAYKRKKEEKSKK